ncbi:hypothetical protein QQ045_030903 [Rhodiola kirilowii]
MDGDNNNTKYFHAKASSRKKTNRIMHLINSEDTELEGELRHVPKRVTPSQNALLTHPYTEREITEALFQLYPSKAPGLNGFHAGFYQKNRSTIKHDFITSCLAALNEGTILPHVNDTLIILLPKQKNTNKMEEFWPIGLTTVIAKTIAKAIVNRL